MISLFLASIGPIQTFIASARRTRDLWFGSTLLSELSKTAARTIITSHPSNELIFPAPLDNTQLNPNTPLKVANKILARIEDEPEQLGQKIERILQEDIAIIYNRLSNTLHNNNNVDWHTASEQIEDLIEYAWVALPLEEGDDPIKRKAQYSDTRRELEQLLAARKNTRNYGAVTWQSDKPKSSIDGQLESTIAEELYARRWDTPQKQAEKAQYLFKQFHAGKAEQLSGVDLLKRMGELSNDEKQQREQRAFFSTSHIASLPYLQRLSRLAEQDTGTIKDAWNAYERDVSRIHLPDLFNNSGMPLTPVYERIPKDKSKHSILGDSDGALLYGERLIEDASTPDRLRSATTSLRDFFITVNKQANESLSPTLYYAIIVADGDGMGKVIDHEAEQGLERHREISQDLDRFDKSVKDIVEGKDGSEGTLIYAGGDDVLAFVPLHRALECAYALSTAFEKSLPGFRNKEGKQPTLSVGIAIVHHLSLLNDALAQARAAEKVAKAVPDKEALAIKLCKRGGEEYTISGHWKNQDIYLKKLIEHYRANRIPKGLPYELRESLLRLTALRDTNQSNVLIEIIKADAKRILERKFKVPKRKQHSETKELLRLLASRIDIQLDEQDLQPLEHTQLAVENEKSLLIDRLQHQQQLDIATFFSGMETYIHELVIARELAEALNLAEGRPVKQPEEVQV